MTDELSLDRDEVERILRRASELAHAAEPRDPTNRVHESALLAAADEVGIPVEAVQRSIAVERLGPRPSRKMGDRLLGASVLAVDGETDGRSPEVLLRLDAWLVDGHHLRRDRLKRDHGEWSKRRGIVGMTVRTIRRGTGEGQLGDVEHVSATAREIGTGACVVRVSVDRRHDRRLFATGGAMVGVVGAAGAAAAATVVAAPVVLVGAPVAVLAGLGIAATGRRRARRTEREIELLLDAIGDHASPTRLRADVVRRAIGRPRHV
jgi:hypothetical protein